MSSFIRNEECLFSAEYFPNHRRDRTGPHIPEFWQLGKLCCESCLATSPPHGGLVPTPEALGSDCQLGREPCLWQDVLAVCQLPFFLSSHDSAPQMLAWATETRQTQGQAS